MKKILIFLSTLFLAFSVFAENSSPISQTTPNLKQQIFGNKGMAHYDNNPPLAKMFIHVRDTLEVSTTFLLVMSFLVGFAMFGCGLLIFKHGSEQDHDHEKRRMQRTAGIASCFAATFLMALNVYIMLAGDTLGIGDQINRNYHFNSLDAKAIEHDMQIGRGINNVTQEENYTISPK